MVTEDKGDIQDRITPIMLSQKKVKEQILGSLKYRVKNKMESQAHKKMKIASFLPTQPENIKGLYNTYVTELDEKFGGVDIFNVCKKSIKDRSEGEINSVVNYLKKNFPVFENIDKGELKEISGKILPLAFEKEERILKEGDMGDYLIILYEGEVEIYRASTNIRKGAKNRMAALMQKKLQ